MELPTGARHHVGRRAARVCFAGGDYFFRANLADAAGPNGLAGWDLERARKWTIATGGGISDPACVRDAGLLFARPPPGAWSGATLSWADPAREVRIDIVERVRSYRVAGAWLYYADARSICRLPLAALGVR